MPTPTWITRLRLFDSAGTQNPSKLSSTPSSVGISLLQHQQQQQRLNISKLKQSKNYYRGEDTKNPYDYKNYKFNLEQAWNPVNNYIYGPAINSVYNHQALQDKDVMIHRKLERILNTNNINNREKEKDREVKFGKDGQPENFGKPKFRQEKVTDRKLLGEFHDNEAPKLCDHAIDDYLVDSVKRRTCSPLESYVSTGRDMVRREFALFGIFLDTVQTFKGMLSHIPCIGF